MIFIENFESVKEYLEKTIAHRSVMRKKLQSFPPEVCDEIYFKVMQEIKEE